MLAPIRSFVAALCVAVLLTVSSVPAFAEPQFGDKELEAHVPVVLDVLLLRPLGLLMTAGGLMLYAFPVLPITAVTRPSQIFKPLGPLVATPARYTFSDPIGSHPPH
jgi:hypothetical protein